MTHAQRDALIQETLPLIKHIAHRVAIRLPSNVEIRDLINAGVLGLMDAIEKFEPERNVKFKTYAEVRIRGAILDSLRDLDWAPRSLRKKSKDLERMYADLSQKLGRPATDEEVSEAMGENIEDFHELVDQLHGLTIGSFENLSDSEDSENYINYYPDDGSNDPYMKLEWLKEKFSNTTSNVRIVFRRTRSDRYIFYTTGSREIFLPRYLPICEPLSRSALKTLCRPATPSS